MISVVDVDIEREQYRGEDANKKREETRRDENRSLKKERRKGV